MEESAADAGFLANPPPSPNKNFPSPAASDRAGDAGGGGPDGVHAMRMDALKKLHKLAAAECVHRLGMLDEAVPVLVAALGGGGGPGDGGSGWRECGNLVVKTLVVLMPLTVRAAAAVANPAVVDALVDLAGEDASVGTRVNVVTLVGHVVETLADSLGGAFQTAAAEEPTTPTSTMMQLDDDPTSAATTTSSSSLEPRAVARLITDTATHRALLHRVTRLLQSGRRNPAAAAAAVSAAHLLCAHCPHKAPAALVSAGAVPALVDLLPPAPAGSGADDRSSSTADGDRAATVLQLLDWACGTPGGRLALTHHYRAAVPRLVACLRPKHERRTALALAVLSGLLAAAPHPDNNTSSNSTTERVAVAAVEAGAASKLVLLIQSGCGGAGTKAKCTELLKYLSNKYSATTMFLLHNNLTQTLQ